MHVHTCMYMLTEKLIKQGYWYSRLCKALKDLMQAFSQNSSALFVNTLKRGDMLASHSLQEYQHLQAQMRMLYVGLSGDV